MEGKGFTEGDPGHLVDIGMGRTPSPLCAFCSGPCDRRDAIADLIELTELFDIDVNQLVKIPRLRAL